MPPVATTFTFPAPGYNLEATLSCGQVFCWKLDGYQWHGWIHDHPITACITYPSLPAQSLVVHCPFTLPTSQEVATYFGISTLQNTWLKTFPDDPWMRQALAHAHGLHLLRQPLWECIASFICSAMKQVPQIRAVTSTLRTRFGREVAPGFYTFPTPEAIAQLEEKDLREAKLGFRSRHLLAAARLVACGTVDLSLLPTLPTDTAREQLMLLPGVGRKIANCVLLFSLARTGVVPVDVWIARGITSLYWRKRTKPRLVELERFAEKIFGPHAGLAQQYLFHWLRSFGTGDQALIAARLSVAR